MLLKKIKKLPLLFNFITPPFGKKIKIQCSALLLESMLFLRSSFYRK
jgi:hypothetical protein